jgi:hypothetical protein
MSISFASRSLGGVGMGAVGPFVVRYFFGGGRTMRPHTLYFSSPITDGVMALPSMTISTYDNGGGFRVRARTKENHTTPEEKMTTIQTKRSHYHRELSSVF